MKFGTISQLIIYVEDIIDGLKFYRDIIGLSVIFPIYDNDDMYIGTDFITFDTGDCSLAIHSGGKKDIGADSPRFNIEVSSLDDYKEKLQDYIVGEIFSPIPSKRIMFVRDPEGNYFYLVDHN